MNVKMDRSYYEIPVSIFVFKRLETVKRIFDILRIVKPHKLYIFADGARDCVDNESDKVERVREFIDYAVNWDCTLYKEYAKKNIGCTANVLRGFDKVLKENEFGIFLEDDVIPTPEFFEYCQELLIRYQDEKKIQFIGGFNAIGDINCINESYCFSKYGPMSGAIAIWKDRWFNQEPIYGWKNNRKNNLIKLKKATLIKEFRKKCIKEYDSMILLNCAEWDVVLQYDLIVKDRYSIVPKRNLVSNCGAGGDGFHAQRDKEAQRFNKYMNVISCEGIIPLIHPKCIVWNKEYERNRQKIFLDISGNWFERRIRNIMISLKDICYKLLPEKLWNGLRKIVKGR